MLEVKNLQVYYRLSPALRGVSLNVQEGELVVVIGANGAGKSTLIRTISGLHRPRRGTVTFMGKTISRQAAHKIVGMGVIQVPEGRGVFPDMSTLENLQMGAFLCRDKKVIKQRLETAYSIFPVLKERKHQDAGTLSGGEQQMLAVGRGLMGGPKLLLLDEPSQGLSPLLVEHLAETIKSLNKEHGLTILLVEQNANMALEIADRGYVLQIGQIVLEGKASELLADENVKSAYLGV